MGDLALNLADRQVGMAVRGEVASVDQEAAVQGEVLLEAGMAVSAEEGLVNWEGEADSDHQAEVALVTTVARTEEALLGEESNKTIRQWTKENDLSWID